jgi:hypothetical protein
MSIDNEIYNQTRINQFRKVKQGKQTLNGLSNYLRLQPTKDLSIFYAGYAVHSQK